ncbi:hypothetical protein EK0264_14155 [Epidermidibacterium keratini]|uniref:Uncharacterized protein n=1 Tax=Epidermidibacterium keratini TaxID=1891644 RepID=A0A7L4YPV4_9ACTN|nr:hypothetical protein [Epidermidibacterium keratini]QHC01311.1 hypothetical protein EK0264_14155 [Epidermidibacterium keratini]
MANEYGERAAVHPGVPAQWPSAWSSVGRQVAMGAIVPVVVGVVLVVILVLTDAWSTAWWFVLIPIAALLWPLSLPFRVRGTMQKASDAGDVDVTVGQVGTLVRARRKGLGVHPSAEVVGDRVRYYPHGGARRR